MNSTDLHSLLTAAPVSRTIFFTQLLAEARPQSETPFEELTIDSVPEPAGSPADPAQPSAAGFSA